MIEPVTMRPFTAGALAVPVNETFTGIVSLRTAGDMREPGPLRDLVGQVGIAPGRLRRVLQVHSRQVVADVSCRRLAPPGGRQQQAPATEWAPATADGLIAGPRSAAAGVTLMVTAADCVPILIAAPGGAYTLLHSGWRGTGIVATAVDCLQQRFGVDPSSLRVVLGPAIGSCCYRVDVARYRLFRDLYGTAAVRRSNGTTDQPRVEVGGKAGLRQGICHGHPPPGGRHCTGCYLDLHAANAILLRRLGVRDIRAVAECTSCSRRLHSSRRDGGGLRCRLMAILLVPGARGAGSPLRQGRRRRPAIGSGR